MLSVARTFLILLKGVSDRPSNCFLHCKISASRAKTQISTNECREKSCIFFTERGENSTKLNLFAVATSQAQAFLDKPSASIPRHRLISLPGPLGKKAFYTADIIDFQYLILYNDLHLPLGNGAAQREQSQACLDSAEPASHHEATLNNGAA